MTAASSMILECEGCLAFTKSSQSNQRPHNPTQVYFDSIVTAAHTRLGCQADRCQCVLGLVPQPLYISKLGLLVACDQLFKSKIAKWVNHLKFALYIYIYVYNSASIPSISVTCYIDLVCAGSSFHKHNLGPHTQTRSHGILFCNKCHPPFDSWPPRPEAIRTAAIADLASNLEALKKGRQELEVGPPNVLTIWCLSGFNLSNIYPTCDVSQGNDPFLPK